MKSHPTRFYFATLFGAVLLAFSARAKANETEKQISPQLTIEGFVLAPDGTPLPGVTVALVTPSIGATIYSGQLEGPEGVRVITGTNGSFSFPSQTEAFLL